MSLRGTIDRYYQIVCSVKQNHKPSKSEILQMLRANGHEISPRTLDRDIEAIRDEFGIELKYDTFKRGYYIDSELSPNMENILRFFELSISAQVVIDSLKEKKDTLQYISFDSSENLAGVHFLGKLLTATKYRSVISFDYFNFQSEKTSNNILHPYLLKEYQNRWFLFGENEKYGDFRIYGIERMSNLKITDAKFEPKEDFIPAKVFENIIGITLRPFEKDQPEQDFVLSMSEEQGRYFKSLPWHPSYAVLVDGNNEFRVKLHLLPNYEFLQQLYRYCDKITVIEPQWLRDHLREKFRTSSEKY